jgi:predicted acylesterase/phospholipase RssA
MSDWLMEVWGNLTTNSIYNEWPEGLIKGIFDEYGAFDDTPLYNLVSGFFKEFKTLKRKIVVSSVEVNTGTYTTFDETTPTEDMPLAVVSSASIPFVFPHR